MASVFYAVMRFISEDVLWDTITTLGMMICFYYGITAFACVWFFRRGERGEERRRFHSGRCKCTGRREPYSRRPGRRNGGLPRALQEQLCGVP